MDKVNDLEQQYDKIYRYCFFKLHSREAAEDITQETFLRFLESKNYRNIGQSLQYLYTIARNLCIDEYRKPKVEALCDEILSNNMNETIQSEEIITTLSLKTALSELKEEEREILLLRYANELPFTVISNLFHMSRFTLYRKITKALKKLQEKLT